MLANIYLFYYTWLKLQADGGIIQCINSSNQHAISSLILKQAVYCSKGVSYGASACGVILAIWRLWPSSQSNRAEWAVTRFYVCQHIFIYPRGQGKGAYIPDDYGSGPPADTALQVLREGDVVVEELEEEVGFLFLEADDIAGDCLVRICPKHLVKRRGGLTLRVNIKCLFPGNRMRPHNRMLRRNRIPSRNTPLRQTSINLLNPRMHSP